MNIFLIGFMGVGKSTIGRRLAKRLGYQFVDIDDKIEESLGVSIKDVFYYQGEEYFREQESNLLKQLSSVNNTCISTGGGIVERAENFELMSCTGKVVYLKAPFNMLKERLNKDSNRPLLQKDDPEKVIMDLLVKRSPLYEKADIIIETQSLSIQQITSNIIQAL